MNDYDFEEQLLLNSLSDYSNHRHQYPNAGITNPNNNISNYSNNNNYHHSHHQYNTTSQQQYFEHENSLKNYHIHQHQNCEQLQNEKNHTASTVSMSTEEEAAFDDFNLFDQDQPVMEQINSDNVDVRMTFSIESTNQKSEKQTEAPAPKLSRRVSKEDHSCPKQQPKQGKVHNQTQSQSSKENHITNEGAHVENPTDSDVLCGQSRTCSNHPGNKNFQDILDNFSHKYDTATSKQEKMCMTKEIVSKIHSSGGRFLRLKNKVWEEISTVAARDKVSHALRTKATSRKRRQEQVLPSLSTSRKSRSPTLSRSSINQHRQGNRRRRSSDPTLSPVGSSEIAQISSRASVIDDLMKSTHDMFTTLVTPGNITSTNHRRSHSQPKTYNADDFNEPIPFHRSDSEPFRQLRF